MQETTSGYLGTGLRQTDHLADTQWIRMHPFNYSAFFKFQYSPVRFPCSFCIKKSLDHLFHCQKLMFITPLQNILVPIL